MRKVMLVLLSLMLVLSSSAALSEAAYHLAGFEGDGTNRDWTTNLFFQRWAEQFGMALSFSQSTEYSQWQKQIQSYLDGGALPDALFKAELTTSETLALFDKGLIVDLKPLIEKNMPNLSALLASHPEWEKAITLPNGAVAALPGLTELQTNNAIWVNKTWLQALQLDMPTDRESFEKVLEAFKTQDPNKNGKQDEIPLTYLGLWDLKFLAHAYGLIANDYNVFVDEAGQVRHLAYEADFHAFVEWVRSLYTKGLIDKDGFTTSDTMRQITDAKAVIPYGMLFGSTPANLLPSAAIGAYEIMLPLSDNGTQVYRDLSGQVARGAFAITSACKDPEALLKALDYLYGKDGAMLAQAGLQGTEYTVDENGLWMWVMEENTDMTTLIRNATISDGGTLPSFQGADTMLSFGDEATRGQISQLMALNEKSRLPYPLVTLDVQTQNRLDELQMSLGALFETQVGRFILGQTELNDANWQHFTAELEANGLKDLMDILQKAL